MFFRPLIPPITPHLFSGMPVQIPGKSLPDSMDRFNRLTAFEGNTVFMSGPDQGSSGIASRVGVPKDSVSSRVGSHIDLGAQHQPQLPKSISKQALDDQLALEFTQMLAMVAIDKAQERVRARSEHVTDVHESRELQRQERQLKTACQAILRQLSTPEVLANRNVRLRIIRGLFQYVRQDRHLAAQYAPIINPLARFLGIGHEDVIRTHAGRKAGRSRTAKPVVSNVPLDQFIGLNWETICQLCGFSPRHYQQSWFEALLARVQAGEDRALLGAPYQVGKTFSCFPLAAALSCVKFPKKTVLIIAPQRVVIDSIIEDLRRVNTELKIGRIDAKRKDYGSGYDVVVASLWTIGRANNLERLNPELYGIVATDEAKQLFTPTGQALLKTFGFIDDHGITKQSERLLFSFSADVSHYSFESVFGSDSRVDEFDLPWYINKGHLHEPLGLLSSYKLASSDADWEVVTENGETYAYPRDKKKCVAEVYADYKRHFAGQKVVIAWPGIVHAEMAAAYFNAMEGDENFSYANHSEKSQIDNEKAEKGFQEGNGPKIIHGVKSLAVGFRAKGATGIIFPYQTLSPNLYGQWIGRILGVHDGEAKREVTVLQKMGWSGRGMRRAMTLARLLGVEHYPGDDVLYQPMKILRGDSKKRVPLRFKAIVNPTDIHGIAFDEIGETTDMVAQPERFRTLVLEAVEQEFSGDYQEASRTTRLTEEELNNIIAGQLPKSYEQVWWLANTLYPEYPARLVNAWIDDLLELMDIAYPNKVWDNAPAVTELIRTVRRLSLAATYSKEEGAHFANGLEFDPFETKALGFLVRGQILGHTGQIGLLNWRDIAHRVIEAAKELDEELIADLLDRAQAEVLAVSQERSADKESDGSEPFVEGAQTMAIPAAPASPYEGDISVPRKIKFYDLLSSNDARDLLSGYQPTHAHVRVAAIKELVQMNFGYVPFSYGCLVQLTEEEVDESPFFKKYRSHRNDLKRVLASLGLRFGMAVQGWTPDWVLEDADRDALYEIYDRDLAALELPEDIQARLTELNVQKIGQLLDSRYVQTKLLESADWDVVFSKLKEMFDYDLGRDELFGWGWQHAHGTQETFNHITYRIEFNKRDWWQELSRYYPILEKKIENLSYFSKPSIRELREAGIHSVWQLVSIPIGLLHSQYYFSWKSIKQINYGLMRSDLCLEMGIVDNWKLHLAAAIAHEEKIIHPMFQTLYNANLLERVDNLELSVRAANCLDNLDITYVWQLLRFSEKELLKIKNFGRKSLNEIKEILDELGLLSFLGTQFTSKIALVFYAVALTARVEFQEGEWPITDYEMMRRFNPNLFKPVDELKLSARLANAIQNMDCYYLWQVCEISEVADTDRLRRVNIGRKSLNELKEILSDLGLRLGMSFTSRQKELLIDATFA